MWPDASPWPTPEAFAKALQPALDAFESVNKAPRRGK